MKPEQMKEWSGLRTHHDSVIAEPRRDAADRTLWAVRLLWLGVACSVTGMIVFTNFGWDAWDYLSAFEPHQVWPLPYSPLVMIPVVRLGRLLPLSLMMGVFVFAYFCGWMVQLWAGMQCATPDERRIFRYVAPVITFFPGLVISDVIASLNVAYILYGLMLAGAAWGWKRQRWSWFYLAVLAAACVKVHMLTMLAIPLLCGRRQWFRTVAVAAAGLGLYAVQSVIWPKAFQEYSLSLKLMSQLKRDFGYAPVGNLARILQGFGVPHTVPCILFYSVYAVALFSLLLWLSRLYRDSRICFESWAPVMLLGVALLNPRILPYDIAWVSLPMAIVGWRAIRGSRDISRNVLTRRLVGAAVILLALTIYESGSNRPLATVLTDQLLGMLIMLGIFSAGLWCLLKEAGIVPLAKSASYASVVKTEIPTFDSVDV